MRYVLYIENYAASLGLLLDLDIRHFSDETSLITWRRERFMCFVVNSGAHRCEQRETKTAAYFYQSCTVVQHIY